MEQKKRSLLTTIVLEKELADATEREGAEQLITHALTMIRNLADKNPQVTHQDLASGIVWKMELHFVNEFAEPILNVIMPFGKNVRRYFRPMNKDNWPAFVRHVQVCPQNVIEDLQERVPELSKVNFRKRVVKCPEAIENLAEPILFECSEYGSFKLDFPTLSELLDGYYPQEKPQPAEATASSAN